MDEAIKAGRRNSDADYQRMRKAYKLAEEMLQTLRDMGYTDFDGDDEADDDGMKAERYGGKPRSELQMNDFVLPEERKFPVMTWKDVRDAVSSWGRYKGPVDFETFKRRLIAIAKRKNLESALPAEWKEEAAMKANMELNEIHEMVAEAVEDALVELALLEPDDDMGDDAESMRMIMDDYGKGYDEDDEDDDDLKVYVYADYAVACIRQGVDWKIPYTIEDGMVILAAPRTWQRVEQVWAPVESSAVKMLEDGTIVAQAIRFGGPDDPDISTYRDYFTKSTDFWLDQWQQRPMLYHHAQDAATADAPVIGTWVKAWADDSGVWLQGQLDRAHKYADAIKDLARRGLLKVSTDSAPHLIKRRPGPNGTNEVQRWPLVAASLTPTPAEPRLMPVSVKSASIATDDPMTAGSERRDGAEAAAERDRLVQDINRLMESL